MTYNETIEEMCVELKTSTDNFIFGDWTSVRHQKFVEAFEPFLTN